ncbi:MAG: DUF488 domain-containing protein [Candidatus Norongarragalinales archaeon]
MFSEFKTSIQQLLERHPDGLTWSEIKEKLNFPEKLPNNKWVRQLEHEIGLKRFKVDNSIIWTLENKTIFTIGYEGLNIDQFIEKLKENGIKQLTDVRQLAFSRKNGFSKGILEARLKQAGIRYKHFPSLGSPKALRDKLHEDWDYTHFFGEYRKHINDEDVIAEIQDLGAVSNIRKTAIMCFEKDVEKCHRSIIKEKLVENGFKVVDL